MKIDNLSLAFNCPGCPAWGTAIVEQDTNHVHLIKSDVAANIVLGVVHKMIPLYTNDFSLPIGKGSRIYNGKDGFEGATSEPILLAKFDECYVNDLKVDSPFLLAIIKDRAEAHKGRLQIKFIPKIQYGTISNSDFFVKAQAVLGIETTTPWAVYDIDVVGQEQLHFKAVFGDTPEEVYKKLKDVETNIDCIPSKLENKLSNLPLQRILYGAPGTGKSYSVFSAIAIHLGIINEKEKLPDAQRKGLENANYIFRTTFHPDYDYAQFVGCYKPTKTKPVEYVFVKDEVEYKTELDKINSGAEGEKVCKRINLAYCNLEIAEKYVDKIDKEKEKSSYSDTRNGINLAKLHAKTGATQTPSITYEFVPQVFTNALVKSYENSDESVYLVIEEINRGNCAQIFGDIFQLLDRNSETGVSEYAINVDEDLRKYLEDQKIDGLINDGKIKLPSNFNIIATMNTSDQSLFPMDSAFKRRWEWEYVKVDYKNEVSGKYTIKVDDKTYNWHTFLKAVNDRIKAVTSSEDKQMGNFFIKGDVDARAFCNKVMFYLWNDISKDYYESNDSLFQYIEEDSKPAKHFSFNELFGDDQTELLMGFMKFIGCDPVPNKPMESETNKEEDSSEN